jgi:steroid 5-alpha reductase family enzyme
MIEAPTHAPTDALADVATDAAAGLAASTLATSAAIAALVVAAMSVAFLVRLVTGRSGWIDTIWSASVGVAGLVAVAAAEGGDPLRRVVAGGLVAAWSLRLAAHIAHRTRAGGDDLRYAALIEGWGRSWRRSLFLFLQVQAAAGLVLVAAIAVAARNPAPVSWLTDGAALAVGVAGLAIEARADRQLRRWRAATGGTAICAVGLWGWSRHPNYLGEAVFWWSWPLLAVDPARPWPALAAALAPLLMAHLLVNVSGIPPLEAHMRRTRGAAWDAHCRRVPRLLPRPCRRLASPD